MLECLLAICTAWQVQARTIIYTGNERFTDRGMYAAFPSIVRADSGKLLVAYRRAPNHGASYPNSGIWITPSNDEGRNWGWYQTETLGSNDPSVDEYSPQLAKIPIPCPTYATPSPACIFLTYEKVFPAGSPYERLVYQRESPNDGLSFVYEKQLPAIGTRYTSGGGKIISHQGTLLMPFYYKDLGRTDYTSAIFRSTDGAKTWSLHGIIAQDPPNGRQFEEPIVHELQDGRLMALIRSDTDRTIYKAFSSDGGATWSPVAFAFRGYGWPAFLQITNGKIVATTRHHVDLDPVIYASDDLGVTWDGPHYYAEPNLISGDYEYADIIEVETNTIGLVYAQEGWPNQRTRLGYLKIFIGD